MSVFEPKKLLVATDLTSASEAAVSFGANLAEALGAEVILFHALSPSLYADYGAFEYPTTERSVSDQVMRIQTKLHRIGEELFPQHVSVRCRALSGYPIPSIVQVADLEEVDLIVMGSHGRNAMMSFLLGSVVQGVLFRTDRPVITVPGTETSLAHEAVRTILCPVNFTDLAMRALVDAAELGAKLGAEVVALHLVEPEESVDLTDVTRRLRRWIPERLMALCQVKILTRWGNAAEEVVHFVNREDVDLIVIGAEHKRFADTTVLGTTTERVIRHAGCAVMTVMQPKLAAHSLEEREPQQTVGT